jgi:uncharacterized protein
MLQKLPPMAGEKNLQQLLKTLQPKHNTGDYVFCVIKDISTIDLNNVVLLFKETEGHTIIITKELADELQLPYTFVASWITLTVHSALEAVGLTAAFAAALTKENISCNVVAAFYHDHIFVAKNDTPKAMEILNRLSQ